MKGIPLRLSLLVLLVLIALPVLGAIVWQYYRDQEQREIDLADQASHLAVLVAAHQSAIVDGTRSVMEAASRLEALQRVSTGPCNQRLAELYRLMPSLLRLDAANRHGDMFCSSSRQVNHINVAGRAYYKKAADSRRFVVSDLIIGRQGGTITLAMAQPVVSPRGEVVAMLVATYRAEGLSQGLSRLPLPKDSTVRLQDSQGQIVAAWPDWSVENGEDANPPTDDEGVPRVYASSNLAAAPHLTATVGLPTAPVTEASQQVFARQVAVVCSVFAFAALAVFLLNERWVQRPIAYLCDTAAELARGNLAARVDPRRAGAAETTFLATSFNEMAEAIESHQKAVIQANEVLRVSNELNRELAAIVESSEDAIIRTTLDGEIVTWNRGAEQLFGFTAEEAVGSNVSIIVPPHLAEERRRLITPAQRGERAEHYETERLRKDGTLVDVSVSISAIRDEEGRPAALAATARDISRQKHFESILADQAAKQKALADLGRQAVTTDDTAAILWDAVHWVCATLAADSATVWRKAADGSGLEMVVGIGWPNEIAPGSRETLQSPAGRAMELGGFVEVADFAADGRFDSSSLTIRAGFRSILGVPIGAAGVAALAVCCRMPRRFGPSDLHFVQNVAHIIASTIARQEGQKQERLLLAELSHRVKNVLALVVSLSRQTGRTADNFRDFHSKFQERVLSLSAAHDLLLERSWRGAQMRALGERILAPYRAAAEGRIHLALNDLLLRPSFAQNLGLMLHELATNAVKYGALSGTAGRLSLTSGIDGGFLRLCWEETGACIPEPPTSQGFGMRLLDSAVRHQHGGEVTFDWRPDGLTCIIEIRLDEVLHDQDQEASAVG